MPPCDDKRSEEADPGHGLLEISGFIGEVQCTIKSADLPRLLDAIQREDVDELRNIDPEYVACFCTRCRRHYCVNHWSLSLTFDGGFYDCTYGTCPAGHYQKLDD